MDAYGRRWEPARLTTAEKTTPRPLGRAAVDHKETRNSTMSRASAASTPIVVDVAVTLTAIVRPEPEAGGCFATIPALPGCHTQGETLDEDRANLREAAESWLAVAHDEAVARDAPAGTP
jgi:predicted RNase H-like HicB family nuclease